MSLYSGGLIIGRIFTSEIWGTYFREGLFFFGGGGLIVGILWYMAVMCDFNSLNLVEHCFSQEPTCMLFVGICAALQESLKKQQNVMPQQR